MKTILDITLKVKNIRNLTLMLFMAVNFLSCSKDDGPEMEVSPQGIGTEELVRGKWYVDLAPSTIAGQCLAQYYLDFDEKELKNLSTLELIDDQPLELTETTLLTKICELPEETTTEYSWASDQDFNVTIGSRMVTVSIISISKTHLIIYNKASDKMMVLKKRI